MIVEIWSDIACPWCYVGKRRFERALADFPHRDAVTVVWRSFELDPGAPPRHDEPQAVLLARKYRVPLAQAEAMNARMAGEAAGEGLTFRLDRVRVGNTFDAHRLLHFAATAGRREALVERLFAAYLGEGEALGEHDVLVRLATDVGLDADAARAVLAGDRFAADVRRDQARARALGVSAVPFFAVDERYGVSGAQPPAAILEALAARWAEAPVPLAAGPAGSSDGCDDGSCTT
jgi:predicted DsbA family dithiol-disulfide isomerase